MNDFNENSNIECHLQSMGMGTLICRAAKQTGDKTTNEVLPIDCFNCEAGKIYREIGCDAVLPKINIYHYLRNQNQVMIEQMICKLKKRLTDYDQCSNCNLKIAETTKQIFSEARSIFEENNFYASYKDIEKARKSIRDGMFDTAITNSISCTESTMKIIHEKMEFNLPSKKTITDLYKSTRNILKLDSLYDNDCTTQLLNNLNGVVTSFGQLRNSLSDAHGKGEADLDVKEYLAELSLNISSTLSTFLIRRFKEIEGMKDE